MVKRTEDLTSVLLATGEATMSQLAQLFETDAKTLPQRLKGVVPAGKRDGYRVYKIRDAAARLVKPGFEIEEFIRQMSPQEMHPLLLKEFWNGQRARLTYEREMGNYWPTEDIVELFGVLSQGIRQTLILTVDDVEREEGFTGGQKKAFRRIVDSAIETMNEKLTERFQEYYANRPQQEPANFGAERLGDSGVDDIRVSDPEDDEEVDI